MLKDSEVYWFPIRIRHSNITRLMKYRDLLDSDARVLKTFIPMEFRLVSSDKMDFTPLMTNYIFVRTTYGNMKEIKSNQTLYDHLRYVMHPAYDAQYAVHQEVVHVPEKTMDDFIRVTSEENDKVIFLNNLEYACKKSQKVQITEGRFAGVSGRVKRIQGNKCVVIPIESTMAVAILDVPRKHLRYLPDEES